MRNDDLLASVTEVAGSKVLPPCVVYAKLGQGGMGAVYRARHLNLDIDVAVKVLKPRLIEEDPQFVARFRREGQSAARISHQNVIRVYDVAEHLGLHYIIMELVVGETARQRVERKGPLAVGEALQILYEAAQGLGEAHRLGFVHRDIKPDNLLISVAGQVKVADMGLAKPAIGGAQSMLSSANQIMGTPSYMPPEQWETTSVTAAADVWALGATFWFLLAGVDAITDPERIPARIMQRILMQPFPDIRAVRSDLPDDVVALLAKATARDAGQRFLDAGEMVTAIDQIGMRRASLRDSAGGTTELHTLVSPPPVKNLEQIKRWLREDFQTRGQVSGAGSKSTRRGGEREPEGEPAPLLPVPVSLPVPAPPSRARSSRWRMAAMLLLVAAGGALAYATLIGRDDRLELASVAAALTFTGDLEPVEARIEGYAVTTKATIAVQGSLDQVDADLFVGTRRLTNVKRSNQGFACDLPVDQEGRQTVTLTARKEGLRDATTSFEVVRLTTGPAVQLVAPKAATTDAASLAFEVIGDEWTRSVEVTLGNMITRLSRAASTDTWQAMVPLLPGTNRFTVRGTNLANLVGADTSGVVECTAKPASITARLIVDGLDQPLAGDGPCYVRSANTTLNVALVGTAPELSVDGVATKPGGIDLRNRLREGETAELVLTPRNDLGSGEEVRVRVVLDTQPPVVTVITPAPFTKVPPDAALKVEGTWRDASGIASLVVDGTAAKVTSDGNSGTFTVELPAPRADRSVAIRAVDRAGNETATNVALVVASTQAVALKTFPGFRSGQEGANNLGYPKVITDEQTGIELVAIDLRSDGKPRLYAARSMTTEAQWGSGSSAPKTGVSGAEVEQWLAGRGAGLDLPRTAEWELIRGAAGELQQVDSGPVEWLKPDRPDSRWPIRKDPSLKSYRYNDSVGFGFRTVFRAP